MNTDAIRHAQQDYQLALSRLGDLGNGIVTHLENRALPTAESLAEFRAAQAAANEAQVAYQQALRDALEAVR